MVKYPIRDTTGGTTHGQVVPNVFTYNPIPENAECIILFGDMKIKAKIDMHFYTNPNFSIFKILKVKRA